MVDFGQLQLTDGVPIYLQIIGYLKAGISAGVVKDGDELPSRRTLSALLGVNPNTIQKAFRLLEEEGLITSRTGSKSFVCLSHEQTEDIKQQLPRDESRQYVAHMKAMGMTLEETIALIQTIWKEETE